MSYEFVLASPHHPPASTPRGTEVQVYLDPVTGIEMQRITLGPDFWTQQARNEALLERVLSLLRPVMGKVTITVKKDGHLEVSLSSNDCYLRSVGRPTHYVNGQALINLRGDRSRKLFSQLIGISQGQLYHAETDNRAAPRVAAKINRYLQQNTPQIVR